MPDTPPAERMKPFRALTGVLLRPRATMTALRDARKRRWTVPALLMVLALTFQGIIYANANAEYVYRQQQAWFETVPAEQRGPMTEPPPKAEPHPLTVGLPIAGRTVAEVVTWLIWAGLIALASTFLGHNGATFGGLFAMIVWARIPIALRYGVQAVAMLATGTPIYNQGLSGLALDSAPQPRASSFQRYIPPTRSAQVMAALLGKIDIYLVWALVLTGIGVWAFAHVPRRRAALVTVGIWIIATAVSLLPAIIGIGQGMRVF